MPVPPWFLRDALLPFVLTRAALLAVGLLAVQLLPGNDKGWDASTHEWINVWSRWDAGWYFRIAAEGYGGVFDGQSSFAFFPLYPALIRLAALPLGRSDPEALLFAGIVVSNLAALAAVAYLVALAKIDLDHFTAARAGLYLLVFPASFFLSAVYTEAVFLLAVVAAFYHARRAEWPLAGVFAAAAALTRPYGILVALAVAVEYLHQRGFGLRAIRRLDPRRTASTETESPPPVSARGRATVPRPSLIRLDAAWLLIPFAALGSWIWYVDAVAGTPLVLLEAQSAWRRSLAPIWEGIRRSVERLAVGSAVEAPVYTVIDLASLALIVALVVAGLRLVRPSYSVFALLVLAVITSGGHFGSMMRLGLPLFPIYLTLATLGSRYAWLDRAYAIVGMALGALFFATFALWYWIA